MTTEPAVTTAPAEIERADAAPARSGYRARWAGVPRELGFLILTFPIALTGFVVLTALLSIGASLLAIVVGVLFVVASLWVARGFGAVEIARLEWARQHVVPPRWERNGATTGWRALFGPFLDGHYWLYLLHTLVVNPIVSLITWVLTVVWVAVAISGITSWFWDPFIPRGDDVVLPFQWFFDRVLGGSPFGLNPNVEEAIWRFIIGVIFLVTLPWVLHGLTLLHAVIARGLLGAWRSEALEREVAQLAASRGAAVQAEDASLRRLERDIHDGPQQRLVRLQMDLAAIERKLEADPDAARTLLGEARDQARDTLDELRALSRGFAPPILQDRGLRAALESVAARSVVPVTVEYLVTAERPLPAAIERNAYFIAAELLTNSVKHADATAIRLRVSDRDTGATGRWLDVWVTDNGRGGATAVPAHGLAGLEERVRGLGGLLVVDSPAGGPTVIGAHFPAASATASATTSPGAAAPEASALR